MLDTIESLSVSKTRRLREWVELAKGTHIYAYVRVSLPGDVDTGFILTSGGPKDEILKEKSVHRYSLAETIGTYWPYGDALAILEREIEPSRKVSFTTRQQSNRGFRRRTCGGD